MKTPFRYPPVEKPRKCFEDSLTGWTALIVMLAIAAVVCIVRFYFVWKGANP